MYSNPWTHTNDSPVNYAQHAVAITWDCCTHITRLLSSKYRIVGHDIMEDIATAAYMRSISTYRNWDTNYPFYNHCWNCVRQVYPEILRKYNRSRTVSIDSYDEIERGIPIYKNGSELTEQEEIEDLITEASDSGIHTEFGTYEEYRKFYAKEAAKKLIRRRSGTPRNPSDG